MIISPTTKLSEIQDAFHKQFTHLKIEFYKSSHGTGEGSRDRAKVDQNLSVGELAGLQGRVDVDIDGDMKITSFEQHLFELCGLNVQVFRRSGNLWLQTITTDNWSLNEANRKGGHSQDLYEDQSK